MRLVLTARRRRMIRFCSAPGCPLAVTGQPMVTRKCYHTHVVWVRLTSEDDEEKERDGGRDGGKR